jgi:hypothetical protein
LRLPESATTCSLVHDAENGFSPRGSFITALLADAFTANFPCGQYWEQCPVRLIGTQIEFVAGADSVAALRPDPEVVAKAKRRTYTAEYKQRILLEAEAAAATLNHSLNTHAPDQTKYPSRLIHCVVDLAAPGRYIY